jgi:hypothetical protein
MILPLWLACTAFVAWFLYRQLPEVFQDLTFGFVVVAVVMIWWAP